MQLKHKFIYLISSEALKREDLNNLKVYIALRIKLCTSRNIIQGGLTRSHSVKNDASVTLSFSSLSVMSKIKHPLSHNQAEILSTLSAKCKPCKALP